jgi:hypothetical protein
MNIKSVCFSVRVPIFHSNFAAYPPFTTMPNTPGLSNAEAKRAQLMAELAAKKKAREEEDAAALKALEDQIAKEAAAAAAARMKEHEEAMALVRAEKRKMTMKDDGVEVVEVRLCSFAFDFC